MLLEIVADREVAEFRRVAIPADRMAARPVAGRHRADVQRHADAVAGVEARAADLGEIPAGPEIARAHLGIGLKAAGRQHHAFGPHLDGAAVMLHPHALDAVVIRDQRQRAGVIGDRDAVRLGDAGMRLDQAGSAAPGLDREAAPELEAAVDLEGLAAVDRDEADALLLHPAHGVAAARHQQLAQIRVGAIFGDAAHVVEELVLRVGAEVRVGDLLLGEVGHQRLEIVDAVIDAAERARREAAVAPDSSSGARSNTSTDTPCSAAARAAQKAAFPAPITMTSLAEGSMCWDPDCND